MNCEGVPNPTDDHEHFIYHRKNIGMGVEHSWQATSGWLSICSQVPTTGTGTRMNPPLLNQTFWWLIFFRYKKCSSTVVRCFYQNQLQNSASQLKKPFNSIICKWCFLLNSFCSLFSDHQKFLNRWFADLLSSGSPILWPQGPIGFRNWELLDPEKTRFGFPKKGGKTHGFLGMSVQGAPLWRASRKFGVVETPPGEEIGF